MSNKGHFGLAVGAIDGTHFKAVFAGLKSEGVGHELGCLRAGGAHGH